MKGIFLQGHLYQPSFPQVKFKMPAPNANKQCILMNNQQHVYFVTTNDFWAYPAWLDKEQL